jgi:hypothetical protein
MRLPAARAAIARWRLVILVVATLVMTLLPATIDGAMAAERAQEPAAASDPALAPAEWEAIRNVIGNQLAALREGDAPRAFAFAAPGIQERFHDAPTFLRMVRESYSPLLEARYIEYLEGAVIDGDTIQPLRLMLGDETVLVALYQMRKEGDRWRIAGCVIAPSTTKSI